MGFWSRTKTIWNSFWNAGLDRVEHAEYSLTEHIREMNAAYRKSESMVATTVAMRTELKHNVSQLQSKVTMWQERLDKATNASEPDLIDLANRQLTYYSSLLATAERDLKEHTTKTEELKAKLAETKLAIENAKAQQVVSVAKFRQVETARQMQKHDFLTPNSPVFEEFERLNNRVREMQAQVDAVDEIRKDPYADRFAKLG